jgi:catechol 2,3-dioxygenase-like lactoylglutathione lyase family enzyme
MLDAFPLYVDLPASDLARAKAWYELKLGFTPLMEAPFGLLYRSGGIFFRIYRTDAAGSARNTAASWIVDDVVAAVAELRTRGVRLEEYAMGNAGPTTIDGVARSADGAVSAWFKDSEGNILSLNQLAPGTTLNAD